MKQEDFLEHDADLPAQAFQRQVAYVVPIQDNRSLAHVVEPGDQHREGGLAHACRPHKRHHRTRRDVQVDVLQHYFALAVSETHVVEADGSLGSSGKLDGAGPLGHIRFLFQQLGNTVGPRQCLLDVLPYAA